jgi:hypothetical protein
MRALSPISGAGCAKVCTARECPSTGGLMSALFKLLTALLVAITLSGCVYSNAITPLDENVDETHIGSKTGRASVHIIAWLVAWGDAGVEAAARNGELEVIHHLDIERQVVLFGLYSRITTIAYGD